jgi:hypothetical protein
MSLCVSEVTIGRSTEPTETTPRGICADMELGAHVARVRSLVPESRATRFQRRGVHGIECPSGISTGIRQKTSQSPRHRPFLAEETAGGSVGSNLRHLDDDLGALCDALPPAVTIQVGGGVAGVDRVDPVTG